MPTGLVTVDAQKFDTGIGACDIVTFTGQPEKCQDSFSKVSLTLRLLGNSRKGCGFKEFGKDETCDIEGVAVCGTFTSETFKAKKVTIPGPLNICSPGGFAQSDGITNSANFRFQIDDPTQQLALCEKTGKPFQSFIAREGFFEACVSDGTNSYCNKQFCKVDLDDIEDNSNDDVPLVYKCKQL
jgi:hypothetical protein